MRDVRFDIMRGIGILLMLLGHIPVEGLAYKLIYSFHMPMFFILAGYFTKSIQLDSRGGYSHVFKQISRLWLPFIVTIGLIIGTQLVICLIQKYPIHVGHVMGPLWFLPAMAWGKVIVGCVRENSKYILLVGLTIGLCAYVISWFWMENKIFLIQGLCALPFLCVGKWMRQNTVSWKLMLLCVIGWICAIVFSQMDVHQCIYKYWLLDIIGACGGTWVLYKLVDRLCQIEYKWVKIISLPLAWLGKYSLALLCMHGLEWKGLLPLEEMLCSGACLLLLRFVVTIILTLIVIKLPIFRKIYV